MICIAAIVWICFFFCATSFAQDSPLPEAVSSRLQSAVNFEVNQKRLPAFSIRLVDRDRNVWSMDTSPKIPKRSIHRRQAPRVSAQSIARRSIE